MTSAISIRPSKDLRTNYSQISALSRTNPVAIDDSCNIRTTFLKHADKIFETFGQDS